MNDLKHHLVKELKEEAIKPKKEKLLLHSCCGPCSCFPFLVLGASFDLYVSYSNSNIYPLAEWEKRLKTLQKAVKLFACTYGITITLLPANYSHDTYMADLKEFAFEKEGGKRCQLCYKKRMEEAREIAKEHHIPYWCTTLTSSRQKDSLLINQIAEELDQKDPGGPRFLHSDWKKAGGAEEGARIACHLKLYRQNYCGCEYSLRSKRK